MLNQGFNHVWVFKKHEAGELTKALVYHISTRYYKDELVEYAFAYIYILYVWQSCFKKFGQKYTFTGYEFIFLLHLFSRKQ